MNTFIPDKNFWCKICGITEIELNKPTQLHHIIPKSLGGQDLNNRIRLCEKCHNILHNTYPKILWAYVIDKENAKKRLLEYVNYQVRYNDNPKSVN